MYIVTNNFSVMLWGLIIEHEGIGGIFLERDNMKNRSFLPSVKRLPVGVQLLHSEGVG